MEDFLRLNLGIIVGSIIFTVLFFGTLALFAKKIIPKEFLKYVVSLAILFYFLVMIGSVIVITRQATVNNIPRRTIDRSFTTESQQRYQDNLQK